MTMTCWVTCAPTRGHIVEVMVLRQPQRAPRQPLVVAADRHAPQQRPEGRLAVHGAPGEVLRRQLYTVRKWQLRVDW